VGGGGSHLFLHLYIRVKAEGTVRGRGDLIINYIMKMEEK